MTAITEPAVAGVSNHRLPPALIALACQCGALLLAVAVIWLTRPSGGVLTLAITQGLFAAALGARLGLQRWWVPINLCFLPAAIALRTVDVHPVAYLVAFVASVSVFRTTLRTRVPLYLSSAHACRRLVELLPSRAGLRVVDLGAGTGTVVARIAQARPDATVTGLELAPLPALIGWWRVRQLRNGRIERADFWARSLADCDVVYAFLSPAPMERLWRKVQAEMKPGALFVSNSFDVPGVAPDEIIALDGARSRALLVWRI